MVKTSQYFHRAHELFQMFNIRTDLIVKGVHVMMLKFCFLFQDEDLGSYILKLLKSNATVV